MFRPTELILHYHRSLRDRAPESNTNLTARLVYKCQDKGKYAYIQVIRTALLNFKYASLTYMYCTVFY